MYDIFSSIASLAPIAFALIVGLAHAFEPDHLFMMSAIVTRRDNTMLALKDGLYWGMGHTVMLVFVGSIIIISRVTIFSSDIIEAFIGGMLVLFGTARLFKREEPINFKTTHGLPFVIGLIHGLAGSGAKNRKLSRDCTKLSSLCRFIMTFKTSCEVDATSDLNWV